VRVDNLTYSYLGNVLGNPYTLQVPYNGSVNFTSIAITPTQTMVSARAGPMQVNLTFLNPIEVRSALLLLSVSTYTSSKAPRLG
jgi:hypothetical protein